MKTPLSSSPAAALNLKPDCLTFQPRGGRSINQSFRILTSGNTVAFFKMNSASKFPHLFEAEAKPLNNTASNHLQTRHTAQFKTIFKKLPIILGTSQKPSLLHGDLRSGNFICKLYPLLIHLLLFGSSYPSSVDSILSTYQ